MFVGIFIPFFYNLLLIKFQEYKLLNSLMVEYDTSTVFFLNLIIYSFIVFIIYLIFSNKLSYLNIWFITKCQSCTKWRI